MTVKTMSVPTLGTDTIQPRRRVLFVAWFLRPDRHWLGEHLDPEIYDCDYVGLNESVDISTKRTSLRKWGMFFRLAIKARCHLLSHRYDLVVTSFPQVAFAFGLLQRLTGERTPHIAWLFNCGHSYQGVSRHVAGWVFRTLTGFAVYTHKERETYSRLFGVLKERFRFTYLTGTPLARKDYTGVAARYGLTGPYLISAGSSGRDFALLIKATAGLSIPLVLVTHRYALEGIELPDNVRVIESIPQQDYLGLLAEADVCIIPVKNRETASGQMTLIQAMALETPVIATRCIGTEDYIRDGETGLFVEMGDADGLRAALDTLLADPGRRTEMVRAARYFAEEHFVDAAGSRELDRLFDERIAPRQATYTRQPAKSMMASEGVQ